MQAGCAGSGARFGPSFGSVDGLIEALQQVHELRWAGSIITCCWLAGRSLARVCGRSSQQLASFVDESVGGEACLLCQSIGAGVGQGEEQCSHCVHIWRVAVGMVGVLRAVGGCVEFIGREGVG